VKEQKNNNKQCKNRHSPCIRQSRTKNLSWVLQCREGSGTGCQQHWELAAPGEDLAESTGVHLFSSELSSSSQKQILPGTRTGRLLRLRSSVPAQRPLSQGFERIYERNLRFRTYLTNPRTSSPGSGVVYRPMRATMPAKA
jgi:hypothetical protein